MCPIIPVITLYVQLNCAPHTHLSSSIPGFQRYFKWIASQKAVYSDRNRVLQLAKLLANWTLLSYKLNYPLQICRHTSKHFLSQLCAHACVWLFPVV